MSDDLRDERFPVGIPLDQTGNGCHGHIFRHGQHTSDFWPVEMEDSLWTSERIDIASDAHFWKTHDIDALAHACPEIGIDGRQILIKSAFFTMHLDEANRDGLHTNLLSLLELEECLVLEVYLFLAFQCKFDQPRAMDCKS